MALFTNEWGVRKATKKTRFWVMVRDFYYSVKAVDDIESEQVLDKKNIFLTKKKIFLGKKKGLIFFKNRKYDSFHK